MLIPINIVIKIKTNHIMVHPENTPPIAAPVIVALMEVTRNIPKVDIIAKIKNTNGNLSSLSFVFILNMPVRGFEPPTSAL